MKRWLNNNFGFTKGEFNGVLALLVLILLITLFPYAYRLIKAEEPVDEEEQLAILKLSAGNEKETAQLNTRHDVDFKPKHKIKELFVFDPNTIGISEWQKLGLSARQAQAILTYRSRGGQFRKTEDLKKMYTISDRVYTELAPYVHIKDIGGQQIKTFVKRPAFVKPALKIIELNGADTTELDLIKGVGMAFANRIIKYRNRIGGFYKKEQLMEVFGIDSVKYLEIKDQVRIDETKVRKININTAQMEDFKNNPYIRYKQVNAILQYRKQHGSYKEIGDLSQIAILTPETIALLKPYLTFEP
jgi:competence protein ComEA